MLRDVLCLVLLLYILALFARSLLSWFPAIRSGAAASIGGFLVQITDPVLKPVRGVVKPVRMGNAMLDLSSLIVVLGFIIVRNLICS